MLVVAGGCFAEGIDVEAQGDALRRGGQGHLLLDGGVGPAVEALNDAQTHGLLAAVRWLRDVASGIGAGVEGPAAAAFEAAVLQKFLTGFVEPWRRLGRGRRHTQPQESQAEQRHEREDVPTAVMSAHLRPPFWLEAVQASRRPRSFHQYHFTTKWTVNQVRQARAMVWGRGLAV
ncbi:MAG: hypothetical protein FJ026_14605 [Chloroflexi bacterium]|nr:hypothetical protein [Chloroflexota bacterium]